MTLIPSFPDTSALGRAATLQELRREIVASHIRAMLRREVHVRYVVNLAGLALLMLAGVFMIQLAAVFGYSIALSGRDAEIVWILSVAASAVSMLMAVMLWWRARSEMIRTELTAIQLRLDLDHVE